MSEPTSPEPTPTDHTSTGAAPTTGGAATGEEVGVGGVRGEGDPDRDPGAGGKARRARRDPLSIAALTVIALAIAIFVTLGIVKVFGTEKSDAVDIDQVVEPSGDAARTSLEVGEAVPETQLELLGGGTTSISDFHGTPLVINFWSSTCAPCLSEMPDFESVHRELDGKVAFLGVDVTDTAEAGQKMVEQTGVTYPNGRDPRAEVMSSFGGIALPRTVLVDADGDVAALHSGAMTADELKASLKESNLL